MSTVPPIPLGFVGALALGTLLVAACGSSEPEVVPPRPFVAENAQYLLNLDPGRITVNGREDYDLRRPVNGAARISLQMIGLEARRALLQAKGCELSFQSVLKPASTLLFEVGFGLPQSRQGEEPSDDRTPYLFEVAARGTDGQEHLLWSEELIPPATNAERNWKPVECPLPLDSGDLVFRVGGPREPKIDPNAPGWGNPRIRSEETTLAPTDPPRNVIVFLVDTLRADHVGAMGYEGGTTPRLDAIAKESLVFTQANSASSWTKASVASLLTSRYPSRHGAEGYPDRLRDSEVTLAEVYSAAGYNTCAVGYNTWIFNPKFNIASGFDQVFEVFDQSREGGARADAVVAEAMDWVMQRHEKPFFLYVHLIDPHEPYVPATDERARFVKPYDGIMTGRLEGDGKHGGKPAAEVTEEDLTFLRQLYDAEIAFADRMLGVLVDRLRDLNLWDEATLVFTADHGEEFLDHGSWSHGGSLYQEQLHVPLVVKPPASAGLAPEIRSAPVSLLDVAPTLCELSKVSPGKAPFMGQSLLSYGNGIRRQTPILAELKKETQHQISVRDGDLKYIAIFAPETREEVYDLRGDPHETRDLIASVAPEQLTALRQLVELHRATASKQGLYFEFNGDGTMAMVEIQVQSTNLELDFDLVGSERSGDEIRNRTLGKERQIGAHATLEGEDRRDTLLLSPKPGDTLRVTVLLNGQPMPPERILLGPAGTPALASVFDLQADRQDLLSDGPMPTWQERPGTWCRIWQLRDEQDVELDAEVLESLRALGYVE